MSVVGRLLSKRPAQRGLDACGALDAAAQWLVRAQDATGCGGVSAYYDAKKRAWAAAYPETTGYIIPSLLRYAEMSGNSEYRNRAVAMAEWESAIQLSDGGVRAGMLGATPVVPTIFNTGQVLFGWLAAWRETGHLRFRESAMRAADWLLAAQEPDGAWRGFASPFATHALNTYNTRVAYALALASEVLVEARYLDAATRNVEWALTQMQANGWLQNNDLEDNQRPLTHTIAYAARGIFEVGLLAANSHFVDAAARMARAVAATQRPDGSLPGRLDANWAPASRWTCVTGNAQMAILWQRLTRETGERCLRRAAQNAIHFSLSIQNVTTSRDAIRGAMPGSWPHKGGYMKNRYPNWAVKFFMDALMLQIQQGQSHA